MDFSTGLSYAGIGIGIVVNLLAARPMMRGVRVGLLAFGCVLIVAGVWGILAGSDEWKPLGSVQQTNPVNSPNILGDNAQLTYNQNVVSNVAVDNVEVGLRFVYLNGHGPTLELINLSDSEVAYTIKYTVILWNLNLPERIDPLPIPVSSFDWIKPRMRSGPQNLFFTLGVEPLLHSGDHLFGCASVTCPACNRDHAYVVSIIWEQGGWFADISDVNKGMCVRPKVPTREGIVAYAKGLSLKVSESSRIPIGSD